MNAGKFYSDFRIRYESVAQDNVKRCVRIDATFSPWFTRVDGFSATFEVEDSRIIYGQDDFAVPPAGFNTGEYSVIADPETTEVDQMFVKYDSDNWSASWKAGCCS